MMETDLQKNPLQMNVSGSFDYVRISRQYFGKYIRNYMDYFSDLRLSMKKADINMALIDYMSVAAMTSIIVFFFMTIFLSIIIVILSSFNYFLSFMLSIFGAIFSSVGIFLLFYTYPNIRIGERRKHLDGVVPFVTLYLTTMSGGGTPPVAMFRTLSKFKDFGEISKEANRIVEEIDILGIDMLTALKNSAERTPSPQFVELLWGMRTVEMSGGDLRLFLREKAKSALTKYKMMLKAFQNRLSMIIEIYLIVVMVASIFLMVILSIIGTMAGQDLIGMIIAVQILIVLMVIPLASGGVLLFIKSIKPEM